MDLPFTKEQLIARYLYGLNLTDDNGFPFPDEMYDWALRVAFAWAKRRLDTQILPVEYYGGEIEDADFDTHINLPSNLKDAQGRYGPERHDYFDIDRHGSIKLDNRPVIEVSKIHVIYPGRTQPVFTFDRDWCRVVHPLGGMVNIVPPVDSLPNQALSVGGGVNIFVNLRGAHEFPDLLRVYYKAGFQNPEDIPEDILHAVGMFASMMILNPAGDLIVGAGIASTSLSFAGLSQSVNTTSSATNAGYGSRIGQYLKELKTLIPLINAAHHGIKLTFM